MSYERIKRAEDARIRMIDKERNPEGTNGIGKAFSLRPMADWKTLMALNYGPNGRKIGGRA